MNLVPEDAGYLWQGPDVRNALRANLVEKAELWRWSSLGRERSKFEEAAFPILSDWPLPRPVDWLDIVNQPQSEAVLAAVRRCVNRGCPYGDADWIAQTARSLGLELTLRPRGRPRASQ